MPHPPPTPGAPSTAFFPSSLRLTQEKPGQTLQATALVHEAYVRLVDVAQAQHWDGRGHFFAAAAESMRRILIDNARRKARPKHGGNLERVNLDEAAALTGPRPRSTTCWRWMRRSPSLPSKNRPRPSW